MIVALLIQKQKQVESADREIGEIAQVKSRQNKLLGGGDKAQYHEKASFRHGGDRESTRPYLTDSTNRMEIMSMEEGGNKLKAPPQSHPIPMQRSLEYSPVKQQGAGRSGRRPEMASSSDNKPSTEERLKAMDTALENLKQLLQFQLDFLENLDSEAGRRMEKLEEDITTTKIGFTEELGKLHRELKNPQQEFEERIDQLEAKMAQLNSEWKQDPKN
jgi:hypothetical protein